MYAVECVEEPGKKLDGVAGHPYLKPLVACTYHGLADRDRAPARCKLSHVRARR